MGEEDHRAPLAAAPRALSGARDARECRLRLNLLGIPTLIIADSPELLATVRAAYAAWVAEGPGAEPRITLRLRSRSTPSDGVSLGTSVEGSRLRIEGDGISGAADAATNRAECALPARLIGDASALAEEVGDTLLLFLVTRNGRVPVHAAGILAGDTAWLLAGPSGSGKSSLALAAAKQGLPILSDDTIFVQRDPVFRVWGFPRPIHLSADDAPPGATGRRLRGGRLKAAFELPPLALSARRARLILLDRGGTVALEKFPADAVIAQLGPLEPGFDLMAAEWAGAIRLLAAPGAWRLTLNRDPAAAITLLRERLGVAG